MKATNTSLRLWHKIVLMLVTFVIPLLGLVVYFLVNGVNKDIAFAQQEKRGNAYQRPLAALLKSLPDYALAVRQGLSGQALTAVEAEIDKAFATLETTDREIGQLLQFTDEGLAKRKREDARLAAVKGRWEALKQRRDGGAAPAAERLAQVTRLVADVRTMITHAGDTSNLILDPDLDSYYTMDATLVAIPQTQDRLGVISVYAADVAQRGVPSPAERIQLAVYAAQLKEADADRISASVQTALNEDAGAHGTSGSLQANLPAATKTYATANAALIGLLDNLVTETNASVTTTQLLEAGRQARTAAYDLWITAVQELDQLLDLRTGDFQVSRRNGLLSAATAVLVAAFLTFFILRTITRPLNQVADAAERVVRGDLNVRANVETRDEIGLLANGFNRMLDTLAGTQRRLADENTALQSNIRDLLGVVSDASDGNLTVRAKVTEGALGNVADALNLMFDNIGDLLGKVRQVAGQVGAAATQIQGSADSLAHGAEKQSDEITNTTAAVQEMTANIEAVATNAATAAEAARRAKEASEDGNRSVSEVISGMEKLREDVQALAKKIKRLGERSMEISTITSTIAEISNQTNILALNAAIEAARAGEQGRGFAVVAEEVRKLAERTAGSTREIEKLISSIQSETNEAVASMEAQTHAVEQESRIVSAAGDALARIREVSLQSAELVTEINLSGKQQVRGANGVAAAMEVVAQVADQARVGANQTKQSTQGLTQLADELNRSVAQFKLAA